MLAYMCVYTTETSTVLLDKSTERVCVVCRDRIAVAELTERAVGAIAMREQLAMMTTLPISKHSCNASRVSREMASVMDAVEGSQSRSEVLQLTGSGAREARCSLYIYLPV